MRERGYSEQFAEQIYSQIKGFADYGFPESHSASFALLAYVSSWLKCHYPAAFTCALLNSQPMGFYAASQLVQDLQRHGVTVLPVDVNHSERDCSLVFAAGDAPALRLGLCLVKGLSAEGVRRICEARQAGPFRCVQTLVERTGIERGDRESLAAADALRGLASDRHRAFWDVAGYEEKLPLFAAAAVTESGTAAWPDAGAQVALLLPRPSESQDIIADYNSVGLTLRRHPLALFREHLHSFQVRTADSLALLPNGARVKVAGIVTSRQRPQTASGVTFVTLEDETGFLNLVVWPAISARQPRMVREARLLGVAGTVQISEGVVHVIASELVDLSSWLAQMSVRSRDFC